ncbi:hypothetical protein [Sphingosinicella sp. BN140058]|uniref:hypothetical protein n=1 Tax=Sphingosinicella sp. BN140058 TaxID=1892855 RepID=UPI001011180A|nr:hypothetical protein [Sphingosinicella sp. BN140058]QAY80454.1 hypothetical protein ETR14_27840 [Sphingosinicella sp. BN140058]
MIEQVNQIWSGLAIILANALRRERLNLGEQLETLAIWAQVAPSAPLWSQIVVHLCSNGDALETVMRRVAEKMPSKQRVIEDGDLLKKVFDGAKSYWSPEVGQAVSAMDPRTARVFEAVLQGDRTDLVELRQLLDAWTGVDDAGDDFLSHLYADDGDRAFEFDSQQPETHEYMSPEALDQWEMIGRFQSRLAAWRDLGFNQVEIQVDDDVEVCRAETTGFSIDDEGKLVVVFLDGRKEPIGIEGTSLGGHALRLTCTSTDGTRVCFEPRHVVALSEAEAAVQRWDEGTSAFIQIHRLISGLQDELDRLDSEAETDVELAKLELIDVLQGHMDARRRIVIRFGSEIWEHRYPYPKISLQGRSLNISDLTVLLDADMELEAHPLEEAPSYHFTLEGKSLWIVADAGDDEEHEIVAGEIEDILECADGGAIKVIVNGLEHQVAPQDVTFNYDPAVESFGPGCEIDFDGLVILTPDLLGSNRIDTGTHDFECLLLDGRELRVRH